MLPAPSDTQLVTVPDRGATAGGLVSPGVDGVDFERGEDGAWRYAGTAALVPGAEDQTLGDVVNVRLIARPGEEPEAVLISLTEITKDRRLAWVLQKGTRLSGGDDELFSVAWPTWQEHVGEPVDVRAPERDADGIDRAIAITERTVRLLRHELERATEARQVIVGVASGLGVTRRHVAGVIGVSTGRIQQLLDDAPRRVQLEVERVLRDAPTILELVHEEPLGRDQIEPPKGWDRSQVSEMIAQLVNLGLLADKDGASLSRTGAGDQALKFLRGKRRRRSGADLEQRSTS
jgi:hypothetical protein